MAVDYRHYRGLLRGDILDFPYKLAELDGYLRDTPDLGLVDALIESDILNKLLVPRADALSVLAALAGACCRLGQFHAFQSAFDDDHFAKSLYGLLHLQTEEGIVEDLTHKDLVYNILYPKNPYQMYNDRKSEAFARNGLIEAFEIMDFLYSGRCPRDLDLVFDECKSRYDRARQGMCSLVPVWEFMNEYAFISRQMQVVHVAPYGLEPYPLLLSEAISQMLSYEMPLDNILKTWPNVLEEALDAVLEWPQQDGTKYVDSLYFFQYYFGDPKHAEIFSDMSRTKHVGLMNLFRKSQMGELVLTVISGVLKYKYNRVYGLELILFPWHTVLEYPTVILARDVLAKLIPVKTFEDGPKYVLVVAWYLLKSLLSLVGDQAAGIAGAAGATGHPDDEYILSKVKASRDTLEWYEEKGALDHEIPGVFPEVFEPGALKSFMLESCEEFSKDYYEIYGS